MSENTLDGLITTLKAEGIEAAEKAAREIMDKAKADADKLIREAEAKHAQILEDATKEAEAITNKAQSALEQAARDLQVTVQNDLVAVLSNVMSKKIDASFSPDLVKTAVEQIIGSIGKDVRIVLPETMQADLAKQMIQELQALDGVSEVVQDTSVLSGFSVVKQGEGWSYQVTTEEVAALLRTHLSSKWAALFQEGIQG